MLTSIRWRQIPLLTSNPTGSGAGGQAIVVSMKSGEGACVP